MLWEAESEGVASRPSFGKGDVRHLGEVDGFLRDGRFVEQPVAVTELTARRGATPQLPFHSGFDVASDLLNCFV